MEKSVFEFGNYKAYLQALAGVNQRKGLRLRFAEAAQVQPTYVSLVLNGKSHFSLEQAERISEFLAHAKEERHFFLLLVQKGRAGTKKLEEYFQEQIELIKSQRLLLTYRLGKEHALTDVQQAKYYSSWIYGAVHIALSIPALQNKRNLSGFLQLPPAKVAEAVGFLTETGLVIEEGGKYVFGPVQVRLAADSPNIVKHHANWRTRAIESLDRMSERDLHYSGVFSLAKADVLKVKDQLLEQIKRSQETIRPSAEEELYCFNVDFFNLKVEV